MSRWLATTWSTCWVLVLGSCLLYLIACSGEESPSFGSAEAGRDLLLVIQGVGGSRQLQVELEKLTPHGCQEDQPGCSWAPLPPLEVEFSASAGSWVGMIEQLPFGSYRLSASSTVEGRSFSSPGKVRFEHDRSPSQLQLVLREERPPSQRSLPHFVAVQLQGHPVEPGGNLTLELDLGGAAGSHQLLVQLEAPIPLAGSACPGGGCSLGTFLETFPLSFDPTLSPQLSLHWQAPEDAGDFLHPIVLHLSDGLGGSASLRLQIEVSTPCDECHGQCVDLQSDPSHCGSCDSSCAGPCEGGSCKELIQVAAQGRSTCALSSGGKA